MFNSYEAQQALGLLAAAGGRSDGANFGQRMIEGLGQGERWKAQQAAEKRAQMQDQMQQIQMQEYLNKAQEMKAQKAAMAAKQSALPGLFRAPSNGAPALSFDSLVPAELRTGMAPQAAIAPEQGGVDVQRALAAGYSPEEITKLDALRNIGQNKVARTMKGMQNGREVDQQFDDYGRPVGQGMEQFRAPIEMALGNKKELLDPYTRQPVASFAMGQSPDSVASNQVAWANNALANQRFAFDKQGGADANKPQLVDGQWVYKPDAQNPQGRVMPVQGLSGNGKSTEGERTAGTLLQRLRGSQIQMEDALAGGKTGAEKPSVIAQGLRAVGGEMLANGVLSPARQKVEAAQLDILDAALTLGTGAAYTKEQLLGYAKSYFPQVNDDEATIKDKQDRLANLLSAAEVKAGAAAKNIPTVDDMRAKKATSEAQPKPTTNIRPPMVGQLKDGYRYRGGDPSSPSSWERQ